MRALGSSVLLAAVALTCMRPSEAQAQLAACAAIADDSQRLACYDALAKRERAARPELLVPQEKVAPAASAPAPSVLEERWELRPELKQGIFKLRPYKPLYALAHVTDDANHNPSSPTRSTPTEQEVDLDKAEAKLQFSFKTKVAQDLFGTATDLWFGYTQQSYWQAANTRFSSPFRSTDYEPEAMLIHPLRLDAGGLRAGYVGLSLNHQSNGRGESLSRSWNRVIGELAFESGAWSFHLRPWVRLFERDDERNDNPDIEDYVGRGELIAVHRAGRHVVTLTGRHSLRGGSRSRGSAQVDWAFPLAGEINGHLQLFTGYGENLLDYNHSQTTFGLGISFFD